MFGQGNHIDNADHEDESAEEHARQTTDEVLTSFYEGNGVDEWDKVPLHHYFEDDVWRARLGTIKVDGETIPDALEALAEALRLRQER